MCLLIYPASYIGHERICKYMYTEVAIMNTHKYTNVECMKLHTFQSQMQHSTYEYNIPITNTRSNTYRSDLVSSLQGDLMFEKEKNETGADTPLPTGIPYPQHDLVSQDTNHVIYPCDLFFAVKSLLFSFAPLFFCFIKLALHSNFVCRCVFVGS